MTKVATSRQNIQLETDKINVTFICFTKMAVKAKVTAE